MTAAVYRLADGGVDELAALLGRFDLTLELLADGDAIPGSFWGDSEAGLKGTTVYARPDTPLHSVLHEACHAICMSPERRAVLDGDAGGDYDEENAVCYLQIVLAEALSYTSAARLCRDMDAWGYSFRLGSAQAWFARDAEETRAWLIDEGLLDAAGRPRWRCRGAVQHAPPC
ncbi:MAG: hypothetical protein AAGD86_07020 [Pseudomonadota bacterium]